MQVLTQRIEGDFLAGSQFSRRNNQAGVFAVGRQTVQKEAAGYGVMIALYIDHADLWRE